MLTSLKMCNCVTLLERQARDQAQNFALSQANFKVHTQVRATTVGVYRSVLWPLKMKHLGLRWPT